MKNLVLCSCGILLLLPSCGLFDKKPEVTPSKLNAKARLSGRIYKVNIAEGYVLIRRYGPWRVGDDEIVESRGEGRISNLLPSGERLGEHVAADIRSGQAKIGDGVYIRKISTSQDTKTSTKPEKPEPSNIKPEHRQSKPESP